MYLIKLKALLWQPLWRRKTLGAQAQHEWDFWLMSAAFSSGRTYMMKKKKKKKMRMWRVQLAEQAIRFCIVKTKDSASWEHYHNSNFSKEKGMLFWQSWGEMKWLELNNQVSYNNRTVSVVVLHFMKATSNLQWNIIYGSICCICEKKIIISKSPFYDGYT